MERRGGEAEERDQGIEAEGGGKWKKPEELSSCVRGVESNSHDACLPDRGESNVPETTHTNGMRT